MCRVMCSTLRTDGFRWRIAASPWIGEHYRAVDGQAVATKQAKLVTEIKPVIVDGKHPPVVNPDLFEKVQAKLQRKKGSKPKCNATDGYCLTGSIICGHCG